MSRFMFVCLHMMSFVVVPQPAITIGNCYDSNRRQVFSLELCLHMMSFGVVFCVCRWFRAGPKKAETTTVKAWPLELI